ncbi:MAG TPA: GDP-mannose 4,6-dehydratase [Nitrospinota bacterium]|nr:GDP-mannose 4,6-dehydratase [Nitrospinota bacterium]
MRCLVTGVAGFIGSHLSEALIKGGHTVTGIDCFTNYYPRTLKEKNIKMLRKDKNFTFIEGNLLDFNLKEIVSQTDYIFHQAAQAGVRASWGDDFKIYTENNINATQRLLEASIGTKLKRFIFASSSSVYGDIKNFPMREGDTLYPLSPYGVSKMASESLCYLYWKSFSLPVISLRYFTVYGPRQRPDMAFHRFVKSILKDKEISIYGDGNQTRDFTYVSDIIKANILAMERGDEGNTYNIGGGSKVSINEVLKILEKISGKNIKVKYNEPEKGDMRHTWADINKAKNDLGYFPTVGLEDGLEKEFKWLKGEI